MIKFDVLYIRACSADFACRLITHSRSIIIKVDKLGIDYNTIFIKRKPTTQSKQTVVYQYIVWNYQSRRIVLQCWWWEGLIWFDRWPASVLLPSDETQHRRPNAITRCSIVCSVRRRRRRLWRVPSIRSCAVKKLWGPRHTGRVRNQVRFCIVLDWILFDFLFDSYFLVNTI